jgi:hypothetical protein
MDEERVRDDEPRAGHSPAGAEPDCYLHVHASLFVSHADNMVPVIIRNGHNVYDTKL